MNKNNYFILLALAITGSGVGLFVLLQNNQSLVRYYDFNPNYADAIQQKKPELYVKI